jgi:hypothetical protein
MLGYIHMEKLWKRLGYLCESEFIRDLKGCGIGTRQSYYRMVKVGETLFNPIMQNFIRSLTPDEKEKIYRGYSKFPDLSRVIIDHAVSRC